MSDSNSCAKFAAVVAALAITAGSLPARITVVNTGSLVSPVADDPKTAVLSFDAGASADKLIVQVSAAGRPISRSPWEKA